MAFTDLAAKAQTYFPNLQVKYKDQSTLMQVIGKLLFFNPAFMTAYLTTLGNTIYLPSQQYVQDNQRAACSVFIHECTHLYDEKRLNKFFYGIIYMFPQLLALLVGPLVFIMSWKIVLLISLLCLVPWPAPWRMYFEKRAYFVQMYADTKLYGIDPDVEATIFASFFRNGNYYWMWLFGQGAQFTQEAVNIKAGKSLVETEAGLTTMVKDLMGAAQK